MVPKDHEDSNYKLAYDGFLSKVLLLENLMLLLLLNFILCRMVFFLLEFESDGMTICNFCVYLNFNS